MNHSRKGDLAEYYAVTFLWDMGLEVYKNCGCTGVVDLIAMAEDGTIVLFDVKTETLTSNMASDRSEEQKKLGVHLLVFNPETRQFRFMDHRDETTYTRYRDKQHPQLDLVCGDSGC